MAAAGDVDERVQPAIERLAWSQSPGGSWPLRASFPPPDVAALERCSTRRGSLFVTSRVVATLVRLSGRGQ